MPIRSIQGGYVSGYEPRRYIKPRPAVLFTLPAKTLATFIARFPLGQIMSFKDFNRNLVLPYQATRFEVWGLGVRFYPKYEVVTYGEQSIIMEVKVRGLLAQFVMANRDPSQYPRLCLNMRKQFWTRALQRKARELRRELRHAEKKRHPD